MKAKNISLLEKINDLECTWKQERNRSAALIELLRTFQWTLDDGRDIPNFKMVLDYHIKEYDDFKIRSRKEIADSAFVSCDEVWDARK